MSDLVADLAADLGKTVEAAAEASSTAAESFAHVSRDGAETVAERLEGEIGIAMDADERDRPMGRRTVDVTVEEPTLGPDDTASRLGLGSAAEAIEPLEPGCS